jgi:hypothetical protein
MPPSLALSDFKRKMKHFGVTIEPSGSGHYKLTKRIGNVNRVYIVATESGRFVKDVYVRKTFELTPAHGVSDAA